MFENPWFVLLIGFLAGWLVEWLLDKFLFRPRVLKLLGNGGRPEKPGQVVVRINDLGRDGVEAKLRSEEVETKLRTRIAELEAQLSRVKTISVRAATREDVKPEPADAQMEIPFAESAPRRLMTRDHLSQIRGIGVKYESMLWAAGIDTFAELAACTPEFLEQIIQPESWRKLEYEKWIGDAKRLASVALR